MTESEIHDKELEEARKDVADLIEELRLKNRKDSVPFTKFKHDVADVIEDLAIQELRTYQANQQLEKDLLELRQQHSRLLHSYEQVSKLLSTISVDERLK